MARTFQQVVDRGRVPLNDADKTRYPDADLLAYANDGLLLVRKARPDLFFGNWNYQATEYALGTNIPIPDSYFVALADYVTARAEFRDDEDAMQQRAETFMKLFGGSL
jgi:hypothetical protein